MNEIVFNKVAAMLSSKKGINKELITVNHSFEDLGLDSLDAVELIADLEEEFNVSIPNVELQHIKTVREAVSGIENAMK